MLINTLCAIVPLPPDSQSGAGARSRPKRDPESYPPLSRVVTVALIPTPRGADDGRVHEQHGCGGGRGSFTVWFVATPHLSRFW